MAALAPLPMQAEDLTVCTGLAASWCPLHGDCSCPRNDEGEMLSHREPVLVSLPDAFPAWSKRELTVVHHDEGCPLHSPSSGHAEDAR